MQETMTAYPAPLVYGLDIGTRSIVGTVGYRIREKFYVVAQKTIEHDTRAMIDGQIHDIGSVSRTIRDVTDELEQKIGHPLKEACIAAAGRVLKTVSVHVEMDLETERLITREDIYTLDSYGVEKAFAEFQKQNELEIRFYCVGYSIVKYYMNNYPISNLENHKARTIAAEMIATFLPDDVVDALYRSVELAGLSVANLTLEPIAAIEVAIPEMYRMLNIALIDVGAGTSDISITKDGSIIAYGMLPIAGDSLTEVLARHCLVDFVTAEKIKRGIEDSEIVEYRDIMGIPQNIARAEVLGILDEVVSDMAKQAADKILELNGNKPVSAVFVVGGGGKIETYTEKVAVCLGIMPERCAVRGEEVMQNIEFLEADVRKDSLLVTPIGICLNYYEHSNNFIFVSFNGQRIKLYDNKRLAVVDAAMQAEYPNASLFPKRGESLHFTVNGKARVQRGEPGEAAHIFVNHEAADVHTPIRGNDVIEVIESTAGPSAVLEIGKLPEYVGKIVFQVNDRKVEVPKFAMVNGRLQSPFYSIQQNDEIEMLNYYSVAQIAEFMDVLIDPGMNIYVNNKIADMSTKVYENFSVLWTLEELVISEVVPEEKTTVALKETSTLVTKETEQKGGTEQKVEGTEASVQQNQAIVVVVNGEALLLTGKPDYIFVDVFDHIDFDLTKPQGSSVETRLNGNIAQYVDVLSEGDDLEIYWKD